MQQQGNLALQNFFEALLRQMMYHVIEKNNQSEVKKLKQELSKYNVFTNDLWKNIKDNVQCSNLQSF